MTKPIRPQEVGQQKLKDFPAIVIEAFNIEIAANYTGGSAVVYQEKIIEHIIARSPDNIDRQKIFENGWLNVEEIFQDAGWEVTYDKPAYNESYPATFKFTVTRNDR